VRPNHVYTISEALAVDDGTIAYRQLGIQKLVDGSWVDVDVAQVSAEPGEHATYRFVNDSVPAVVLPLTGGTSTDLFLLIGGIFLLIALSLAAWQQSRRLRGVRGF
jgi:LPXTG-motif cell wall-anchored protein